MADYIYAVDICIYIYIYTYIHTYYIHTQTHAGTHTHMCNAYICPIQLVRLRGLRFLSQ